MNKSKFIFIPIAVCFLGMIIHFLGVMRILEMTSIRIDVIMLMVDALVFIGLIRRKRWGWVLGVVLFIQQTIMQPYWTYKLYTANAYVISPVERPVACLLVLVCLVILLTNRSSFHS